MVSEINHLLMITANNVKNS